VIDAEVLLDTPIRSIAVGHGSSVPLMIGSNEDEGSLFAGPPMPRLIPTSQVDIDRFLEQDHPDVAARVRSAYVNHGRWGNGVALGGDGMVTAPVTAIAEAMSAHAPSYVYRFRWSNADLEGKRLGAPHTIDVPFVWGTLDQFALTALVSPGDDSAVALSRTIQNAWLSFAKKRTPLVDEVGWAPYSPRAREVLVFDRACSLERDPGGRQREAWGSFAS
jgi:para-nitrobenzyl esterase